MRKLNTEDFIARAKLVHTSKYTYLNTKYVNAKTDVEITCLIHGAFWQNPFNHLNGKGCPKCKSVKASECKKSNCEDFIVKAKSKHGVVYDYSKVNYVNSTAKVVIVCETHGEFEQTPSSHLSGAGCPKCSIVRTATLQSLTIGEFIDRSKGVHGETYSYSKAKYINHNSPVVIICKTHGEFSQRAGGHLSGAGCPKCGDIRSSNSKLLTTESFIEKASAIHNSKYGYSKTSYVGNLHKVLITCPEHGDFEQTPDGHLQGRGCSKCVGHVSKPEIELGDLIESHGYQVMRSVRGLLHGTNLELDIYVPELKLAIEYCGLYWHSTCNNNDPNRHLKKLNLCRREGVRLITIFEDEWTQNKNVVISKIENIIGKSQSEKVYARSTQVGEVGIRERQSFMRKNHIQGDTGSTYCFGLYHETKLVAAMSLKNVRPFEFEIVRYATSCSVVGGFSKLLKVVTSKLEWVKMHSFADLRWSEGNVYLKAGFNLEYETKPDYRYIMKGARVHKFNFRHSTGGLAAKVGEIYSKDKSELELTRQAGIFRIYDCGLAKFAIYNPLKRIQEL